MPWQDILLCSAAAAGNLAKMNDLLSSGISPDARDQRNSTALLYAVGNHQLAAAERLLEAGADINAQNLDGETALDSILKYGPPDMIPWLEARGAVRGRS